MPNSLFVEQFKLSEKNALLSFLQSAYPDNSRHSDIRFWDWHFLESPLVEPENLPIWIVKDNQEIVGQLAATPVDLKVGTETRRAIWILDFIILENYRGRGLGGKLVLAAQDFCPLGLGITTNEQISPTLLQKLGWAIVSKVPRYNKLLYPGNALGKISRFKTLRKLSNVSFAPFRPRLSPIATGDKSILRIIREFDSSFEDLWQESSVQWQCGVVRGLKFLNWQYRQQPGKKFDVLGYYENDKLLGYTVLFFRKSDADGVLAKAAITDFCYHPEKAQKIIDELLRGALQIALERRAGVLVTDILDPLIQDRLSGFGFWSTKSPLLLMVKSDTRLDLLYDEACWFLTRGDSDISIFEHPNLPVED